MRSKLRSKPAQRLLADLSEGNPYRRKCCLGCASIIRQSLPANPQQWFCILLTHPEGIVAQAVNPLIVKKVDTGLGGFSRTVAITGGIFSRAA